MAEPFSSPYAHYLAFSIVFSEAEKLFQQVFQNAHELPMGNPHGDWCKSAPSWLPQMELYWNTLASNSEEVLSRQGLLDAVDLENMMGKIELLRYWALHFHTLKNPQSVGPLFVGVLPTPTVMARVLDHCLSFTSVLTLVCASFILCHRLSTHLICCLTV